MIQISLTSALILYSTILGCLILFIWTYTEIRVRRSHRVLEKQFLWHCVFCGYIYLDEAAETLSRCPRCHSYSSAEDKRARDIRTRRAKSPAEERNAGTLGVAPRNTSHRKRPHQRRRGPRKH